MTPAVSRTSGHPPRLTGTVKPGSHDRACGSPLLAKTRPAKHPTGPAEDDSSALAVQHEGSRRNLPARVFAGTGEYRLAGDDTAAICTSRSYSESG